MKQSEEAGFGVLLAAGGTDVVAAVLTAYETDPNTPIYAGQSSDYSSESRLLPANGSERNLQPATPGRAGSRVTRA